MAFETGEIQCGKEVQTTSVSRTFYYQCDNSIDHHLILAEIQSYDNLKFWDDPNAETAGKVTKNSLKKKLHVT